MKPPRFQSTLDPELLNQALPCESHNMDSKIKPHIFHVATLPPRHGYSGRITFEARRDSFVIGVTFGRESICEWAVKADTLLSDAVATARRIRRQTSRQGGKNPKTNDPKPNDYHATITISNNQTDHD